MPQRRSRGLTVSGCSSLCNLLRLSVITNSSRGTPSFGPACRWRSSIRTPQHRGLALGTSDSPRRVGCHFGVTQSVEQPDSRPAPPIRRAGFACYSTRTVSSLTLASCARGSSGCSNFSNSCGSSSPTVLSGRLSLLVAVCSTSWRLRSPGWRSTLLRFWSRDLPRRGVSATSANAALEPAATMCTEPCNASRCPPTILVAGDHFSPTPRDVIGLQPPDGHVLTDALHGSGARQASRFAAKPRQPDLRDRALQASESRSRQWLGPTVPSPHSQWERRAGSRSKEGGGGRAGRLGCTRSV